MGKSRKPGDSRNMPFDEVTEVQNTLEALLNPTGDDRLIAARLRRRKELEPEWWRAMAKKVFGIQSERGARLLMAEGVVLQIREVNRQVDGRWLIDADGEYQV